VLWAGGRQIAAKKRRLWLAMIGLVVLWAGGEAVVGAEEPDSTVVAESPAPAPAATTTEVDILAPARAALADGRPEEALELAEGARQAGQSTAAESRDIRADAAGG